MSKAKAPAEPQAKTKASALAPPPPTSARIAIIGGGISGLVAAKQLAKMGYHRTYIFDAAPELGGNSNTGRMMVPPYERWADLGVNDYNTKTYENIQTLIDELGVKTRPLEDSISYSTADGRISYTAEPDAAGEMVITRPRSDMSESDWNKFLADIKYFYANVCHISKDPHFADLTVQAYITKPFNPANPATPEYYYGRDFIDFYLLPRINGMYFAQATGPHEMPIVLVTNYYILQEGYNESGVAPKPDRRYFVDGTRKFIEALQNWLLHDYDTYVPAGSAQRNADLSLGLTGKFILGHKAAVYNHSGLSVSWEQGPRLPVNFDRIIIATHADKAAECLQYAPPQPEKQEVMKTLLDFKYETSVAFVHHDKGAAPARPEHWRTYNIHIYDYQKTPKAPYTITYVENRHQNDKDNPEYKGKVDPIFFTTLNPFGGINTKLIYPRLDDPSRPVKATFYHNVATMNTQTLQKKLRAFQDRDALRGVFLAGGYVIGVGLHEECWHSGDEAAQRAVGKYVPPTLQSYGSELQAKGVISADYAPDYIRRALKANNP